MTIEHLIEIALGNTAPQVAFIIGLLYVILKLGQLWIRSYFSKVVPMQERQVSALEKMAEGFTRFSDSIAKELKSNSIAIRALWAEWEHGHRVTEPMERP